MKGIIADWEFWSFLIGVLVLIVGENGLSNLILSFVKDKLTEEEKARRCYGNLWVSFWMKKIAFVFSVFVILFLRVFQQEFPVADKLSSIGIFKRMLQHGNSWGQFLFSLAWCGLIFCLLLLTGQINRTTYSGVHLGILSSVIIQTGCVLLYYWIQPAFHIVAEQTCYFAVMSLTAIILGVWLAYKEHLNDLIGCSKGLFLVSAFGLILLIPTLTLLLPGWWGTILTLVVILAVEGFYDREFSSLIE